MYRTMLVPLDGSTFAENGLSLAATIAERAGALIRLVLVHSPLVVETELAPVQISENWKVAQRERELEYLQGTAEGLRARGLRVETELRDGDVGDALVEAAEEVGLVVMATHGRGGLARAWLGSVADEVVRRVSGPVLLTRPPSEEEADGAETEPVGSPAFRHIMAATDGSEAASVAVDQAVILARLFDARLTLLRVVAFPAGLGSPYIPHTAEMDREVVERGKEEAARALAERAAEIDGVAVDTMVEEAFHPARGILTAATKAGCDLLAVGTDRRSVLGRVVLGSTADKVIRGASFPVLVGHSAD